MAGLRLDRDKSCVSPACGQAGLAGHWPSTTWPLLLVYKHTDCTSLPKTSTLPLSLPCLSSPSESLLPTIHIHRVRGEPGTQYGARAQRRLLIRNG